MRRESLTEKKKSKGFYCTGFQKAVNVLFVSVALNICFVMAIHSKIAHKIEPNFYASDGVSSPIMLNPLDAPNESSTPLLPDDPHEEMMVRAIPDNV